jgi:hypothetical protein
VPTLQVLPLAHFVLQTPPQSTSPSFWFLITSLQVAFRHLRGGGEHERLMQSLPVLQLLSVAQRGQLVFPPQSVSLSPWFLTTSLQVAAWQTSAVHTRLAQSLFTAQAASVAQPGQPPPQSMSVSVPFMTPSLQPAFAHKLPLHTFVVQSVPRLHALPTAHLLGQLPPQSTSVSLPFLTRSVQVGV